VKYRLEIKEEALRQLRALAKEHRRNIGWRLDAYRTTLQAMLRSLRRATHEYRLRVGSFRILFTLEADLISV
jgi:mRNA interferase RelE/StbE